MSLSPEQIVARLEAIDEDLAARVPALERAAEQWFRDKREREYKRALHFVAAEGTVAERNAAADGVASMIGVESEAEYESLRAVVRVLETRATIGQSLLKAQRERGA